MVGDGSTVDTMTEIREIHEDELDRWVATMRAAVDETDTVEGYIDWKRQARETVWLLATDDGATSGRRSGSAAGIRPRASPAARSASSPPCAVAGSAPPCSPSSPPGHAGSGTPS